MRLYTELMVQGNSYSEIVEEATKHWKRLNANDSAVLPADTEIKVRLGDLNAALDTISYMGYVTIRSKVETND